MTGQPMQTSASCSAAPGRRRRGLPTSSWRRFATPGSLDEARQRICTVDSQGLVTAARPALEDFKAEYARPVEEVATYECRDPAHITLEETIRNFRPTTLIGTSGKAGLFTEGVVRAMAAVNDRPIVFPLSNPTSKSECTAAEAIQWSEGRAIVATGSPFDPVVHGGRTHRIGQGNNSFVFPGVGLGLWVGRVARVTDEMFLDVARALAHLVSPADLAEGAVFPALTRIRDCSHAVACAVIRRAVAEGHAAPGLLTDLEETVTRAMWIPAYRPVRYRASRSRTGRRQGPDAPHWAYGRRHR